jgi:hypothetical protein
MRAMRKVWQALPMGLVRAAFTASVTQAKRPEYAKKEKGSCVTCHVKNGFKEMNDAGCYEKKKTLEGCKAHRTKEHDPARREHDGGYCDSNSVPRA